MIPVLLTMGHGTLDAAEFVGLASSAGVARIVDVRRYPGSRRLPHFARAEMERWLPAAGIEYRWEERLGGRRRPVADSRHTALRNGAFRAYADHMETPEFREALGAVIASADAHTAVLCAESLWWRCHRRLIADAATLLWSADVRHLLHDGRAVAHELTAGVRREGSSLIYDDEPAAQARLPGVDG